MDFDTIVIGAGVVGLAVAKYIAEKGMSVLVVEKCSSFGQGISSRNSEVIHAGIYYKKNSLKHLMCVKGRRLLCSYIEERSIPFNKCGKLIVATSTEEDRKIQDIHTTALRNGVENLSILSGSDANKLEPEIRCTSAILSEKTGIIDSHAYMLSLVADIENNGGTIV